MNNNINYDKFQEKEIAIMREAMDKADKFISKTLTKRLKVSMGTASPWAMGSLGSNNLPISDVQIVQHLFSSSPNATCNLCDPLRYCHHQIQYATRFVGF